MAGYRPKSLDELNSIFDKTMAAEKAIKKGSSLLEKGEDGFSSFSAEKNEEDNKAPVGEEKQSEEITDSVSEFIAKFSAQTEQEPVKAKPKMTVLSAEAPKKDLEIESEVSSQEPEAPRQETEKPSRDELFDEYARIMSDEDDDAPTEKKLSRKEKKRLKKKEKAEGKALQEETIAQEPQKDEDVPFDGAAENVISQEDTPYEDVAEEEISAVEKDDFDFPENYTPEWIREGEEKEPSEEEKPEEKKSKGKHTFLKIILSLVLVAVISVGALATVFKTVVAVNTGKLVSDKYYVFTTYKDYGQLGLSEGELVITEKKYAEDGEVFAYVDYGSKTFEFGKRTDSITKEDGEVLYVTEKDGGRTLVSRDDCKGVIYLTYEGRGNIVSFLTDNYIIIVAAVALIALIIVLVFALAFRTKKEEKGEVQDGEKELSEDPEEDFEDIFSTIE